ncbi:hypothetical protein PMIN01_02419 [Paraphaeosphaeria minitans]|uniref:Secreted protein n=1 Tax=Paraphaeosphaeria minitans TaxID=565426 RepID=A0A9P6GRG0_9PLEO|nr:hypothetical protein PMIN01_02419 [Paraphaeosphaeria minitans]
MCDTATWRCFLLFQGVFLSGSGQELRSMDAGKRWSTLVVALAGNGPIARWWKRHTCGWVVSSWIGFKFRIAVMGRSGKFCWRVVVCRWIWAAQ